MKLILFLAFALVTNNCLSQEFSTVQSMSYSTNSYTLQFPKSWTIDTSREWGPALFIFSPIEDEKDKFRENVNVLIQNLNDQSIDLEKYKTISEEQIINLATDGKIIESSIETNTLGRFFRITYTMTQGIFSIKITSICFIKNGQAFLATFSSEARKYDKYQTISQQILSSFSLKE